MLALIVGTAIYQATRLVATVVAMSTMPLRDVKNHLSEVVDRVEREHERVVITKRGAPAAVVISVDDLESLEETVEVASRPELLRQVVDSLVDVKEGRGRVLTKEEARGMLHG